VAHDHAHRTNCHVDYKLEDKSIKAYESVQIENIKNTDIQQVYKDKLKHLRQTYPKLRLHYSGGMDSHTILALAEQEGIEFDQIINEGISVNSDPYVDEEMLPGREYCKKYGVKFVIVKPSMEAYEKFADPYWYEKWQTDPGIDFRTTYWGVFLPRMEPMLNITGTSKPWIYVDKGQNYYYVITDRATRRHMGFEQCSFFEDAIFPEVAVKQALVVKEWLETYRPEFRGLWTMGKFQSDDEKKSYLDATGREPALSRLLFTQEQGKKTPNLLSIKTKRAMQELRDIGRGDVVKNYMDSIDAMKKKYGHMEHCLTINEQGLCHAKLKFGAVFKITNTNLKQVSDTIVKI